ncbi:MAG TPA: hypothetical protein VEJ86_11930, partial [Candidatus Binataceae bacterium]|nr:hypothetical protein [Candidatus Binataceae bacterium]
DLELLEVNRDGFTRMFKARPEAANTIADVASKRLEETRARASQSLPEPTASATSRLLSVMRQLFDF